MSLTSSKIGQGRVTSIYSQLLAELRWNFVALEKLWLQSGLLSSSGDIFFLEFAEIRAIVEDSDRLPQLILQRREQLEQDNQLETVPFVFYGNEPPPPLNVSSRPSSQQLQGIGASPGLVEGRVKILRNWQTVPEIDRNTIIVVPYTDSAVLSAKIIKDAKLKIYKGYPHGMLTTHADVINPDLLEFIKC